MVQYKDGKSPATAVDADRFEETEDRASHKVNGQASSLACANDERTTHDYISDLLKHC